MHFEVITSMDVLVVWTHGHTKLHTQSIQCWISVTKFVDDMHIWKKEIQHRNDNEANLFCFNK